MSAKLLLCICGPTASGKTKVAIELAQKYQTEIVSADSRQFYREMSIGTAVPSELELATVPHHFIQSHSVENGLTAGQFAKEANELLLKLFEKHNVVVLAGGSGFFVKALLEGFDRPPAKDPQRRSALNDLFEQQGLEALRKVLSNLDSENALEIDLNNPQRIIRAIELLEADSSKTVGRTEEREYNVQGFVLNWDRDILYKRIEERVDQMMEAGLLNEVESLSRYKHLNALQTVGYKELFDYLEDKCTMEEAIELIKRNTRRYAKRQMTWFRNQSDFEWVNEPFVDNIVTLLKQRK